MFHLSLKIKEHKSISFFFLKFTSIHIFTKYSAITKDKKPFVQFLRNNRQDLKIFFLLITKINLISSSYEDLKISQRHEREVPAAVFLMTWAIYTIFIQDLSFLMSVATMPVLRWPISANGLGEI